MVFDYLPTKRDGATSLSVSAGIAARRRQAASLSDTSYCANCHGHHQVGSDWEGGPPRAVSGSRYSEYLQKTETIGLTSCPRPDLVSVPCLRQGHLLCAGQPGPGHAGAAVPGGPRQGEGAGAAAALRPSGPLRQQGEHHTPPR